MELLQLVIMELLQLVWNIWKLIIDVFLLWFIIYSFWHGAKIESGNVRIEFYGIARFFK